MLPQRAPREAVQHRRSPEGFGSLPGLHGTYPHARSVFVHVVTAENTREATVDDQMLNDVLGSRVEEFSYLPLREPYGFAVEPNGHRNLAVGRILNEKFAHIAIMHSAGGAKLP